MARQRSTKQRLTLVIATPNVCTGDVTAAEVVSAYDVDDTDDDWWCA